MENGHWKMESELAPGAMNAPSATDTVSDATSIIPLPPSIKTAPPPVQPVRGIPKARLALYTFWVDMVTAMGAWVLFYVVRRYVLAQIDPGAYFSLFISSVTLGGFWCLFYALAGFYTDVLRRSRLREIATITWLNLMGGMLLIAMLLLDDAGTENYPIYLRTAGLYLLMNACLAIAAKTLWLTRLKRLLAAKRVWFNTILVGAEASAKEVYEEIEANSPHLGIRFSGFVHIEQDASYLMSNDLVHLGHYSRLEHIISRNEVEQIIIATEPEEHRLTEKILNLAEGTGVRTYIMPDIYQILLGAVKVNHILGAPLIEIRQHLMPLWQQVAKRMFDVVSSVFILVLLSPLYLFLGIMTRLSSPGPIIFSQERIGRHGKPFRIFKFRSMVIDAEVQGPSLSSSADPRITPWGLFMRKTRLDEFPQFYNVLKGDMSLVGPRPERQHYIDQIVKVAPHYKHLNRVRPGITSLGQVKFGYAENVEQMVRRLRYDIMYIENMSLAMDLRIMIFTVMIMVKGKGK